jgi:ArsR family transcriptional regulator
MMLTSSPLDVNIKPSFVALKDYPEGGTMPVDSADVTRLARIAKALADPIRLRMLGLLGEGRGCCEFPDPATRKVPGTGTPAGICVCEFQVQFGLGQSRTSYHLRVLKEAGLVTEETRGKWSFYAVDGEAVSTALSRLRTLFGA